MAAAVLVIGSRIEDPQLAVWVLSLGAGFNAFAAVSWWAVTIDLTREFAASLSGLMNMAGNLGGTISPALTPYIANRLGWTAAIDAAAFSIAAAGLLWFAVNAEETLLVEQELSVPFVVHDLARDLSEAGPVGEGPRVPVLPKATQLNAPSLLSNGSTSWRGYIQRHGIIVLWSSAFLLLNEESIMIGKIEAAIHGMARAIGFVILFALFARAATTFDVSGDFSLENNPNENWQYGYSVTNSLEPGQFRLSRYADRASPIGFWHPSATERPGPGYYPYIGHNSAKQSRIHSSNGWALRAGQIAMEASNTGQYSIVRFVAPVAGSYKVAARYEGIHFGSSSTDVHVLHNGVSLFQADIDGYGGDPAFHKIQGSSPTGFFSGRLDLKDNDIVTFAVGYGNNKTHFSDTTGLSAQVVLLSNK